MSSESPAAVLFDSSGNQLATAAGSAPSSVITIQGNASGTAVPISGSVSGTGSFTVISGTAGNFLAEVGGLGVAGSALVGNPVQIGGSDGTNTRALLTSATGQLIVVGAGTAGSTSGGVVSVQGVASGTNLNVAQGTASALNATVVQSTASNLNAAVVGVGTAGAASGGVLTIQGVASMTPVSVTVGTSATGTITSVAASASSVTILASNAARKSATIYNECPSGELLYLALTSSAASVTVYTIKLWPNTYYDLPIAYTGQITGIWTGGTTGSARVTELT